MRFWDYGSGFPSVGEQAHNLAFETTQTEDMSVKGGHRGT